MKPGDVVLCEHRLADAKGFRTITQACVQFIEGSLVIVVPHATYAYHPDAPGEGRYLPPARIDCYGVDEVSPGADCFLRDIIVARPTNGRHKPADAV